MHHALSVTVLWRQADGCAKGYAICSAPQRCDRRDAVLTAHLLIERFEMLSMRPFSLIDLALNGLVQGLLVHRRVGGPKLSKLLPEPTHDEFVLRVQPDEAMYLKTNMKKVGQAGLAT